MPVLTDLPYDCILEIASYLNHYRPLCRTATTCCYLNEQIMDEEYSDIWERQCQLHVPREVYRSEKRKDEIGQRLLSWRHVLRRSVRSKKMDALVAFIGGDTSSSKGEQLMRAIIDVSFKEGGCIGTEGAKRLAGVMAGNNNVETLDASDQLIRDAGLQALYPTLGTCASLSIISLANNRLSSAASNEAVTSILIEVKNLRVLDLSGNGLSLASVGAGLKQRSSRGLASLERLQLDNMTCSNGDVNKEAAALLESFHAVAARNGSLRVLSLRSVGLDKGIIPALLKFADEWASVRPASERKTRDPTSGELNTVMGPTLHLDITNLPHQERHPNVIKVKPDVAKQLENVKLSGAIRLAISPAEGGDGCACC